jgi:hypothetical protein
MLAQHMSLPGDQYRCCDVDGKARRETRYDPYA